MRSAILTLPLITILGCPGGPSDDTGTSAASGTTGGSTSGTSGTTVTPTSSETSVDPTTGPAETSTSGSSMTGTTTGGPAATTSEDASSGDASSGDASTGAEESSGGDETTGGVDGDYAAFYFAGGLDRIMVRKRNVQDDLCTVVIFVWPGPDIDPMGFFLELPGQWGVQGASVHQGAEDCLEDMMFPMDPVFATGGLGASTWVPVDGCPATLDIDVELTFEMTMPWVPLQDHLDAQAVPVQGC